MSQAKGEVECPLRKYLYAPYPLIVGWAQVTVSGRWAMKVSDMGHSVVVTMETVCWHEEIATWKQPRCLNHQEGPSCLQTT